MRNDMLANDIREDAFLHFSFACFFLFVIFYISTEHEVVLFESQFEFESIHVACCWSNTRSVFIHLRCDV